MSLVPRIHHGSAEIPVAYVRGGTSTGAILEMAHVPSEPALRDELLVRLMGVGPGASASRQSSGLGRGHATSNKVFLTRQVEGDGADLETTLAQLAADKTEIDWRVTCGNLTAALALYALDRQWVQPADPLTRIRMFNTNTDGRMQAIVRTPGGRPTVPADTEIPGVVGRFPGVALSWLEPGGQKTGSLLPTGRPVDELEGTQVSCVDAAVPMVIVRAQDLGKTCEEAPGSLDADVGLLERLRKIRVAAGRAMGLLNADGSPMSSEQLADSETMPKMCLIAPGTDGAQLNVRYFTPQTAHRTLAVSGGSCLAAASLIPGTLANAMAVDGGRLTVDPGSYEVSLRHPAGLLTARVEAQLRFGVAEIHGVGYTRSAQILMRGHVPLYGASDGLKRAIAELASGR